MRFRTPLGLREPRGEFYRRPCVHRSRRPLRSNLEVGWGCAPWQGGAFQWVRIPPGEMLQPEATGAVREVTNWLKPLGKASHDLVAARVCRPQRE
jgi:hypothetical protein